MVLQTATKDEKAHDCAGNFGSLATRKPIPDDLSVKLEGDTGSVFSKPAGSVAQTFPLERQWPIASIETPQAVTISEMVSRLMPAEPLESAFRSVSLSIFP
jgi:hypothetical protein